MNIETVINITHFSVSVKQLIGFLRACIGFPRTCFWAAGTSSPRLLPNSSSIWLPASLLLGSWHLFPVFAAQLLEYLASRGLGFGQPVPLSRACCPFSHLIGFPRTYFWAADTSSPRLLPKHPPGRQLRNRFWHIQDSKPRRSTNKSTSPQRKRAHTGSFSQIVSILGEVKLVNIYIRYSWHLGSHM